MLEDDDAISILSEKVLERDKKEREEGRGHSKTGISKVETKAGMGRSPRPRFPPRGATADHAGRSPALTG